MPWSLRPPSTSVTSLSGRLCCATARCCTPPHSAWRTHSSREPATVDTRFRIASVSKIFTAVAIMQLVDEGSIELDEPFARQLGVDGPFTDPRIAAITVRQLMSHLSGFSAAQGIFFGRGVETWHQAAQSALGEVLQADPGTAFQYSNTNFCLLGLLLEKVTGQPFEAVIRERVLQPIGISAHLAPTFDTERGDALHASSPGRNYMEALGPAGGWVASPLDIAKLASALRDESDQQLLDPAAVDAMRVRVSVPVEVPPPANGWSYGMGLMLFGDGSWGHTGTIESTHAVVVNRPDGLTVAILVSGKEPRQHRRSPARDRAGRCGCRSRRIDQQHTAATFAAWFYRTRACRPRRSSRTSTN